jgi:hypothetical protein
MIDVRAISLFIAAGRCLSSYAALPYSGRIGQSTMFRSLNRSSFELNDARACFVRIGRDAKSKLLALFLMITESGKWRRE